MGEKRGVWGRPCRVNRAIRDGDGVGLHRTTNGTSGFWFSKVNAML
jgi:hypothetical protein